MGYEQWSKNYHVTTPNSRRLVKKFGRGSKQAAVENCFKDPITKSYLIRILQTIVHKEIQSLCSDKVNSVLRRADIRNFNWDQLLEEVQCHAPVFFAIIQSCAHTTTPRMNKKPVIGICIAVLLKHKFHKLCLIQKLISIVLYAGHAGKEVHNCLLTGSF